MYQEILNTASVHRVQRETVTLKYLQIPFHFKQFHPIQNTTTRYKINMQRKVSNLSCVR